MSWHRPSKSYYGSSYCPGSHLQTRLQAQSERVENTIPKLPFIHFTFLSTLDTEPAQVFHGYDLAVVFSAHCCLDSSTRHDRRCFIPPRREKSIGLRDTTFSFYSLSPLFDNQSCASPAIALPRAFSASLCGENVDVWWILWLWPKQQPEYRRIREHQSYPCRVR
jgi:hypothetical protein